MVCMSALPALAATGAPLCDGAHGNGSVWKVEGARAVVICVHDLACCSQSYKKMALFLNGQKVDVVACDIRELGCHQSPHGMRQWLNFSESAAQLASLVSTQAERHLPVYLLGEGLGADLAWYVAVYKAENLQGLVLANLPETFYKERSVLLKSAFGWVFRPNRRVVVGVDGQRLELMPAEAMSLSRAIRENALTAVQGKKKSELPVLYIRGRKDPYSKQPFVLRLLKNFGKDRVLVESPEGHLLLENRPSDKLLPLLRSWLRNCQRGSVAVLLDNAGASELSKEDFKIVEASSF